MADGTVRPATSPRRMTCAAWWPRSRTGWRPVDVLVHVVGGWLGGTPAVELDPADVATSFDQHVFSTLHMVQAVVPGMVERGWGRVFAISQPLATEPGPRGGGYLMAKAAQEVMLRSLARDLAGSGVTANLLIVKTIDKDHERDREPTTKNAQWTTPEEIAAAMVMLCGDDGVNHQRSADSTLRPLIVAAMVEPNGAGPIAPTGEGAQHVHGSGAGTVGLPALF